MNPHGGNWLAKTSTGLVLATNGFVFVKNRLAKIDSGLAVVTNELAKIDLVLTGATNGLAKVTTMLAKAAIVIKNRPKVTAAAGPVN
jgi:hypothetical protein